MPGRTPRSKAGSARDALAYSCRRSMGRACGEIFALTLSPLFRPCARRLMQLGRQACHAGTIHAAQPGASPAAPKLVEVEHARRGGIG